MQILHPYPIQYSWEAVSKEIKIPSSLTGATSQDPSSPSPEMTPALQGLGGLLWVEECPCYILGSVDAPLWGSPPPPAQWPSFLSV